MRKIFLALVSILWLCLAFIKSDDQNKVSFYHTLNQKGTDRSNTNIITGADQTGRYLGLLRGKHIGMTINQTSTIGKKLSMDSLLSLGIHVVKCFGPEHGFRGNASDGVTITNSKDEKTGISIISLYG